MLIEFRFVFKRVVDFKGTDRERVRLALIKTFVSGELPSDMSTNTSVALTQRWNRLRHNMWRHVNASRN